MANPLPPNRKIKNRSESWRSPELTDDLIERLAGWVERGNLRKFACAMEDVVYSTFKNWCAKGRMDLENEEDTVHGRLEIALLKAEGKLHDHCVINIKASDNPEVKLKYLQLRWNKYYNRNPNITVDDETGVETKVDARKILAERLGMLLGAGDGKSEDDGE